MTVFIRLISIFGLLTMLALPAFAQTGESGDNPFELLERVGEEQEPIKVKEPVLETPVQEAAESVDGNPFEARPDELEDAKVDSAAIAPVEEAEVAADPDNPFERQADPKPTIVAPSPQIKIEVPKAPKGGTISHFWLGGIFIGIMALLAFFNTVFRSELRDTFRAFTNSNILSLLYRERKDFFQGYFLMFYLFFIINMGVFLFLAGAHLNFFKGDVILLLGCVLLVGGVICLRHFLINVIRKIFPFNKELGLYAYVIAVYNQMIGLLLLPFSLALAFSPLEFKTPVLYVALSLLGLIYLYRTLRGLVIANKFLAFHKFHFFVYLCSVEIAPIIILVKLISNWGAIV